jgi:hypothetical protein
VIADPITNRAAAVNVRASGLPKSLLIRSRDMGRPQKLEVDKMNRLLLDIL